MRFSEEIKAYALSLGFDACGICPAGDSGEEEHYMQWLLEKCHAGMDYLERHIDKRLNPVLLVEGAQSIISVALNYYPHRKLSSHVPQFAYYAYGKDYHKVMKDKLEALFRFIRLRFPEVRGRCFVDSAPVLERFWAAKAGLGFIGKNTLLIIPQKGSYFFLGELIIDKELDYDDFLKLSCGNCRKCLNACPTGAIEKPYWLNANKCISYQTIENKGEIDPAVIPCLQNNVYGCDICQQVCPWNRFAVPHCTPEFFPSDDFLSLDFEKLEKMNEETFRRVFRDSAVKRAKFQGLKRNIEALGKSAQK
ncbi:MAG: tRNA epoxyqueuosine(34) reductase QueG [Bacteroidales bacterium]|jgi:epoxyqueuosine reductase|nr:tRNA epoxyqueuosine(34) reductase QueG [Bacteroidales bacterium]